MTTQRTSFKTLLLASACLLSLSACATTGANVPSEPKTMETILTEAMHQTAATQITPEMLKILETDYRRAPDNQELALRYATALRQRNDLAKATLILQPFAESKVASPVIKTEYAAFQLEAGNYKIAEAIAKDIVAKDPANGPALNTLGIAQDAQGKHEQSEKSFRAALANWSGDPVPVMNNLALTLLAQGYLDEASSTLRAAKDIDPSRQEIERNIRIVDSLRETAQAFPEYEKKYNAKKAVPEMTHH